MIKAIETSYRGYRFRSRLEARWAVFFDALSIPWVYESEGFDLGSGERYLPDFLLTMSIPVEYAPPIRQSVWVEIKPEPIQEHSQEWSRARALADSSHPVLILSGIPGNHHGLLFCNDQSDSSGGSSEWDVEVCGASRHLAVASDWQNHRDLFDSDWNLLRWVYRRGEMPKGFWYQSDHACRFARAARFEHGEKGTYHV